MAEIYLQTKFVQNRSTCFGSHTDRKTTYKNHFSRKGNLKTDNSSKNFILYTMTLYKLHVISNIYN